MNAAPIKPYLMRAIHEWCSDQGYTPYLVVAVRGPMQVPMEFVKHGEIVLNISYNATRNLHLGDDYVRFSARFNGQSRDIIVPIGSVISLFARETGEGMAWEPDAHEDEVPEHVRHGIHAVTDEDTIPVLGASEAPEDDRDPPPPPEPAPSGGKPRLRVVK
ncbi:ClpXP protease specificity-enhancing factor [Burkholderiaceae bacterium DAT-1]|nr:ClpXP protease specificity-enhancing factor [Burkholderiaceae bacterium DAT-1]